MTSSPASKNLVAFAVGSVLVGGFFYVQHVRHGWPFSLHHGVGTPPTGGQATASTPPVSHAGHRVPVHIPDDALDRFGITVVDVRQDEVAAELRAVATIVPDESRVSHVHTRVSGWIERVHVRTTGESVRPGAPLLAIFSQELLASQTEYLAVRSATGEPDSPLARGARDRLGVLGMSEAEVRALERRGRPSRTVTVSAPRGGVVLHRGATVGASVDPSIELFTLADLSRVWLLAEVPESRAPDVAVGSTALVEVPGSGRPPTRASVDFVYPTLTEQTRTLRVRFVLDNPDGSLRPGMFGTAVFDVRPRRGWFVPRDAIVDTGTAAYVFVQGPDGTFDPRTVRLGSRLDDRVQVIDGLAEGDRIVASGVFLVDSESRLRASGGAGAHAGHGGGSPASTPSAPSETSGRPDPRPTPRATRPSPAAPAAAQDDPHASHRGH